MCKETRIGSLLWTVEVMSKVGAYCRKRLVKLNGFTVLVSSHFSSYLL